MSSSLQMSLADSTIESPALLLTFHSGNRLFGVPVTDVKEVTTETQSTSIPHTPEEVSGYVNIRGHICLAIDLAKLLNLPSVQTSEIRQMIIFNELVGSLFGIIVDQMGEIVSTSDAIIETSERTNQTEDSSSRFSIVTGTIRFQDTILTILQPRRFLPYIECKMDITT